MTGSYADIARLLRSARRRQVGIALITWGGVGISAALVCILLGAVAFSTGARPWFRFVALCGALAALVSAAIQAAREILRRVGGDERAARTLTAADPGLRSALQSSVELFRARREIATAGQLSVALIDAHVEHTAARARALDLARAIPDHAARRAGWLVLGVLLLTAGSFLVGHGRLLRSYARVLRGDLTGAPVQLDPITGDIELTYRYPAYMRREPRTLSGTGGEVRAPKGTEVSLRTRADRVIHSAEIVVDLGAEPMPMTAPKTVAPQGTGADPAASGRSPPGPRVAGEPALRAPASRAPVADPARGGDAAERSEPGVPPAGDGNPPAHARAATARRYALQVTEGRELSGSIPVTEPGSYRFRFFDAKGRLLVEGPPIPIAVEPDAYPTVQITSPDKEIEVDPGATVEIAWQAEDDVGLGDVTLVLTPPAGGEKRIVLRSGESVRRDDGTELLSMAALQLSEGERLAYRVEAQDTDDISGPKTSSTATQFIRIYSEAEHRRQMLDRARQAFEELVSMLGDRLDLVNQGSVHTEERLPLAQALDGRTKLMTEHLRLAAQDLRRDPAGPREVAQALENVSHTVRFALEGVIGSRTRLALAYRMAREPLDAARRQRSRDELRGDIAGAERADAATGRSMEQGILYLEQLLDKQRADDLVRLAKDLSQKRRTLADLMEKYRKAPSEAARQDLLAQLKRMKEQVRDLLTRMAELSKGFNDEHMNEEALAELTKSQDLMGRLDEVEKKLAQGDVEGALKDLDQMASTMDRMMAGLSRTAGMPDERAQALMREMLAFKDQLQKLEDAQKATAEETEKVRAEYRRRIAERLKQAEAALQHLHELAQSAQREVEGARPGITFRSDPEFENSTDALRDLERSLGMRELDGANEAVQRAEPSMERLSVFLEQDASSGDIQFLKKDPALVDDAHRRVTQAIPKVRDIRDQLSRLFPDPRSVLSREEQQRLGQLAKRQAELEQQAGRLQEALDQLAQRAPLFPPAAQGQLGESRGHMGEAASELGNRNPQRGHGEQELALDALSRFKKGLEDASKGMRQQGGEGAGFPFPFAQSEGSSTGDGYDPSHEKVKIPGAEAHKVPEAFRRDLLEAMKQGTPERYRPDVQRYYEELVK
ncbi:MAG TPA: hypothetical protein VFG59_11730 [Anaeromyxobacter sp.]|nr:hypothetical protein [Anaeromyxobacter sp.]